MVTRTHSKSTRPVGWQGKEHGNNPPRVIRVERQPCPHCHGCGFVEVPVVAGGEDGGKTETDGFFQAYPEHETQIGEPEEQGGALVPMFMPSFQPPENRIEIPGFNKRKPVEPVFVEAPNKKETKKPRNYFCCPFECGFETSVTVKFEDHVRRHTGERPFKCTHPGCDFTCATEKNLKKHTIKHLTTYEFICEHPGCEYKTNRRFEFSRHLCKHTGESAFVCPEEGCNEGFPTRYRMNRHVVEVHSGLTPEEQRPFVCPVEGCDKAFFMEKLLDAHMSVHGERVHQCTYPACTAKFRTPKGLKGHLKIHTGERPHKCTVPGCGYSSVSAQHVKRHMQRHTKERPYTCTQPGCDGAYSSLQNLRVHLLKRHGVGSG